MRLQKQCDSQQETLPCLIPRLRIRSMNVNLLIVNVPFETYRTAQKTPLSMMTDQNGGG